MPTEAAEDLEACQPLLHEFAQHLESKKYQETAYDSYFDAPMDEDFTPQIDDPMTYKLPWLKAWGVFTVIQGTVWDNQSLWMIMARLLVISALFATLAYNVVPDPHFVDVAKFSDMNAALSAFVVLSLSFFLASAVSRWISCVTGLMTMFNSIKNYSMQLHALGVNEDRITLAMRYCVLSAHFLIHELRCLKLDSTRQKTADALLWDYLTSGKSSYARVDASERKLLELVDDKSGMMWIWVASYLGRMAADGDVPPMASPTYGRLMNLVQAAQDGHRECRIAVVVQMPLVYLHTLAFLVHINSLLFAIITGIAVGTTCHGIRTYIIQEYHLRPLDHPSALKVQPLTTLLQALVVEVIKGFAAPLLFQAFLHIGCSIVSPLEDDDAAIPARKLLHSLETDLKDARFLANKPPHWDIPRFKKQSASSDHLFEQSQSSA